MKSFKSLRIEYDTDYGIDKRTGWSATVDGVVVVQFEVSMMAMLAKLMRYQLQRIKEAK